MKIEDFNKLGLTIEEWNDSLTDGERLEFMKPHLISPFDIPKGRALINPFSFKIINGVIENGVYITHIISSFKVWKKYKVKDNRVTQAFNCINNKWVRIPKPWGTGKGENN